MSETTNETVAPAAKEKKAAPEQKSVVMADGRTVVFVGKRRMLKESFPEDTSVTTRFDFVDGTTRSIKVDMTDPLALKFVGHGIEQKVGDETAGVEAVEDMVINVDAILARLQKGEWSCGRAAGDGFSGAGIVIRAIVEATGKTVDWVKAFLEKKLEAGKAEGLTRQKLYSAFRTSGKTKDIIARMEAEKASKDSGLDGAAALDEMMNAE